MKKISEHLAEIIVALAGIMIIITAITLFSAPIGCFFDATTDKLLAVGNGVLSNMDIAADWGETDGPLVPIYAATYDMDCDGEVDTTFTWDELKALNYMVTDEIIECDAFYWDVNLISINLPESVTTIGDYAFFSCVNLESITLSEGLTTIGDCAFQCCYNLSSITLPDGVTTIGCEAFGFCSLKSITLPEGITTIGDYAFSECHELTDIKYEGTVAQWNAITIGDRWIYSSPEVTVPEITVTCTDGTLIY